MYSKEEELDLPYKVRITKEVRDILSVQKRKQDISMAKIICNAILEKYGQAN